VPGRRTPTSDVHGLARVVTNATPTRSSPEACS
jgi:hypothetical protein